MLWGVSAFLEKNVVKVCTRFNVISVTRGWVEFKFPGKMRYVTLEWPLTITGTHNTCLAPRHGLSRTSHLLWMLQGVTFHKHECYYRTYLHLFCFFSPKPNASEGGRICFLFILLIIDCTFASLVPYHALVHFFVM